MGWCDLIYTSSVQHKMNASRILTESDMLYIHSLFLAVSLPSPYGRGSLWSATTPNTTRPRVLHIPTKGTHFVYMQNTTYLRMCKNWGTVRCFPTFATSTVAYACSTKYAVTMKLKGNWNRNPYQRLRELWRSLLNQVRLHAWHVVVGSTMESWIQQM